MMDYDTQHAIDSAVRDCENKANDIRFDLERQLDDLKRDIARCEGRIEVLKEELESERERA